MSIFVAGRDRTNELEQRVADAIARRHPKAVPNFLPHEISALSLLETKSETAYLLRLLNLIRFRDAADTLPFEIPRKPGLFHGALALFRSFLWRLLRYQHDRIAFRQNMINGLFTGALEYELLQREFEINELRARVEEIERLLKKSRREPGQTQAAEP